MMECDDPLICNTCGKNFKRKGFYDKHIITCGKPKDFRCDVCDKKFRTRETLDKHKQTCNELTCQFCKKTFKHSSKFLNHMCEKKSRHLNKDDRSVYFGFMAYKHFIIKSCSVLKRKDPSYEDFCKSDMYKSFVEFGKYILSINAINPMGFVDFLIKTQSPMRIWTLPNTYELYVRELNKTETPDVALERNFLLMQQWAIENNEDWKEFFRKVSPSKAVLWIKSGRISPWLLFSSSSSGQMLSRLNSEQTEIINELIDVKFWELKIAKHKDEVLHIQKILNEAGI